MGQIRWGDFERVGFRSSFLIISRVYYFVDFSMQAMKRIGFGIAQTAGSSVRFDPPAKAARPITFHRVDLFSCPGLLFVLR
jgi:hypothetical protein